MKLYEWITAIVQNFSEILTVFRESWRKVQKFLWKFLLICKIVSKFEDKLENFRENLNKNLKKMSKILKCFNIFRHLLIFLTFLWSPKIVSARNPFPGQVKYKINGLSPAKNLLVHKIELFTWKCRSLNHILLVNTEKLESKPDTLMYSLCYDTLWTPLRQCRLFFNFLSP